MSEIRDLAALEALYGQPRPASLAKVADHVTPEYARLIEAAPFVVIASSGPDGLDVSPRGDPAPVARVLDSRTVAIPDRRGNNRIDTLRNIVADPRVALLFLIPGLGETMRIAGTARIVTDAALLDALAMEGRRPVSAILVTVEQAYFQCRKALVRSRLWEQEAQADPASLPTAGEILEAQTRGETDGAAYDAAYPERMKRELY